MSEDWDDGDSAPIKSVVSNVIVTAILLLICILLTQSRNVLIVTHGKHHNKLTKQFSILHFVTVSEL